MIIGLAVSKELPGPLENLSLMGGGSQGDPDAGSGACSAVVMLLTAAGVDSYLKIGDLASMTPHIHTVR
jgi:hypothetical protein